MSPDWLVRHGTSGEDALRRIAKLRVGLPDADWHRSPENPTPAAHGAGVEDRRLRGGASPRRRLESRFPS